MCILSCVIHIHVSCHQYWRTPLCRFYWSQRLKIFCWTCSTGSVNQNQLNQVKQIFSIQINIFLSNNIFCVNALHHHEPVLTSPLQQLWTWSRPPPSCSTFYCLLLRILNFIWRILFQLLIQYSLKLVEIFILFVSVLKIYLKQKLHLKIGFNST